MASADAMEREIERRRREEDKRRRERAILEAAARAQGITLAPVDTPVDVPRMTEAAGPIIPPEPKKAGFMDNLKNLGGTFGDAVLSFVPGTQQSDDLSYILQTRPQDIPIGAVKSVVRTGSNIVDLAPVIDTGEPGINYVNAYRRGEGLTMGAEDLLNLFAAAQVAKAAVPAIRTNITNPGARFNPYEYGIHVNVPGEAGEISKIIPRQPGQATVTGGDSIPGTTYMWDATSPDIAEMIMRNPQMTNTGTFDVLYDNPPAAYFTRAPRSRVGTDINIPSSPSLSVRGTQTVLEQVPLTEQALKELLARRRVMQSTEDAAMRKIFANSAKAGVPDAIGDNNAIMAYNWIRDKIVQDQGFPGSIYSKYDPNITIDEVMNTPELRSIAEQVAASRIQGQAMQVPDVIRDRILAPIQSGGAGFTEGQYRAIVREAERLNDAGIPFEDAIRQVLDDSITRRAAGETLPEVVRDSGMARIGDPRANERLGMLTDEQIIELVRQLGATEARKALGNPNFGVWQDRLNRINSQGTPIPGRSDAAIAAFTEMDDAALLRMLEGRNREKVRKQLGVPTQAFYERVNRLIGEAE